MTFSANVKVQDYPQWRRAARELLQRGIPPEEVVWTCASETQELLFECGPADRAPARSEIVIPRSFFTLAESVACHSDRRRWSLLYRTAWRLTHGERHLLELDIDDDVAALYSMRKAVARDLHRMQAFVRFRRVDTEAGEQFVAWYQPDHHIVEANSGFFRDRFGAMRWAILTPHRSVIWDLEKLHYGPGVPRSEAPSEDQLDGLWRLYYRTIYNPARLNLTAMRTQLPMKSWNDLPEARTIPELARMSNGRVQGMLANQSVSTSAFIPEGATLPVLREAVRSCGACELCSRATQAVWGEGNPRARIMLVGEQPGDEEDRRGSPFVGPAGQVLDRALREAGLEREQLYITNAVKAFIFEERGKRRIHQTPHSRDIAQCRPWLLAELEAVQPEVVVCLGASAAESVLGRKVQIGAERGRMLPHHAAKAVAVTYHPSAILRAREPEMQGRLLEALQTDLARAKAAVLLSSPVWT